MVESFVLFQQSTFVRIARLLLCPNMVSPCYAVPWASVHRMLLINKIFRWNLYAKMNHTTNRKNAKFYGIEFAMKCRGKFTIIDCFAMIVGCNRLRLILPSFSQSVSQSLYFRLRKKHKTSKKNERKSKSISLFRFICLRLCVCSFIMWFHKKCSTIELIWCIRIRSRKNSNKFNLLLNHWPCWLLMLHLIDFIECFPSAAALIVTGLPFCLSGILYSSFHIKKKRIWTRLAIEFYFSIRKRHSDDYFLKQKQSC